jgi:hypothetical protein
LCQKQTRGFCDPEKSAATPGENRMAVLAPPP